MVRRLPHTRELEVATCEMDESRIPRLVDVKVFRLGRKDVHRTFRGFCYRRSNNLVHIVFINPGVRAECFA